MKICLDICLQPLSVSFEEQIMSKEKYPNVFSNSKGSYCVYYPSNIFATHAVLKIGEYSLGHSPVLAGTSFKFLTCVVEVTSISHAWQWL